MRWKTLLIASVAALAPCAARAQSVHWDPPGGTLPVGEVTGLQLSFSDCTPDDAPAPPKVDGLTIQYQGQSTSMSLINGTFSRSVAVTFAALLTKKQSVDIPAFKVKTSKGELTVPAAHFEPAGATVGSTGVALSSVANARIEPQSTRVWAGEVFDLKYTIDIDSSYGPTWGRGAFEWDPSPLVAEDWSQPEPFSTQANGARTGLVFRARALAPAAGHVQLNQTSQLVNLSVPVAGFGFFQQRQYQQFAVNGTAGSVDVRPLPPEPQGFSGAVGEFSISSRIVPSQVKAGEPVTWTIELSGTGNWPNIRGLPQREVSSEFQVIQPKPKRTQPQGKLFEGTLSEDVVLVANHPGTYSIAPVAFTFFDPKQGAYRTVTAPGSTVTIEPAAVPAPVAPAPAAPGGPATADTAHPEAKAPEAPTGALGDPLPSGGPVPSLIGPVALAWSMLAPVGGLLLFWAALALRRARRTDPLLGVRQARERLGSVLDALPSSGAAERSSLLLEWQHNAAILWGIRHAAPGAAGVPDPLWSQLWAESDRCLYGPSADLPGDWTERARAALAAKPVRAFNPASLLLPRNLFPIGLLLLAALPLHADEPSALYRAGSFAAAEKAWAARLALDPTDASARHNLSLALSQQDRWGEAAAQASAAFVLDPSLPAIRRQVALACDKAAFVPEPVEFLMQPGPASEWARLQNPGAWERTAVACAAACALGLALVLASLYRGARRAPWVLSGGLLLALGLIGVAASWGAFRAYGIASDPRVAIAWRSGTLRSVPTEADAAQKTTALPAGSMGIADRTFLHWVRLSFPNGETGWVSRDELVFVWQNGPG